MPRLGIAIALVVLAAFGLSGAVAWAASPNQKCTTSGPNICADIVGDPATVSPSKPDEPPHFVTYSSTVANGGPESATHVTADLELTGGLVLVSATPSVGSCSVNAVPTCSLGRLAGGDTATIDFTARVPREEGPASATLTATFGAVALTPIRRKTPCLRQRIRRSRIFPAPPPRSCLKAPQSR